MPTDLAGPEAARHRHAAVPPHRGGVATTSPWRRAPVLLLRRPAVFLAIVAASAVLAIAAASGVLFVSTLDSASLQVQAGQDCPERSMPAFGADVPAGDIARGRKAGLAAFSKPYPGAAPYAVEVGFAEFQTFNITMYSRADALDHVQKLSGPGGPGVWIPDNFVKQFGVQPGQSFTTGSGVKIRVAGVYKSMSASPFTVPDVPRYFCNWTDLIVRRLTEHGTGPFLISDEETIRRTAGVAQVSFYEPLPLDTVTVPAAEHANRTTDADYQRFQGLAAGYATPLSASEFAEAPSATTATLDVMLTRARTARTGVSGSVLPIDLAGVAVAGLLVAAAGAYWAGARTREIRLLTSRGVGPGGLAAKAALETGPALVVGLAGGVALAVAIVRAVAPSSVLGPNAVRNAVWCGALSLLFGVVVIALIGAVASRDRPIGLRRRWWTAVPFELLLLVVAWLVGRPIYEGRGIKVEGAIVHVSPALVLFPMIGTLAGLLVLGRLIAYALPWIRRKVSGGGPAFYLALRRIVGSRGISVGLIVCVALPTALLTYTSTLTESVDNEVAAKYRTNVGAQHVLNTVGIGRDTPNLRGEGTAVVRYQSDPRLPGNTQVNVLGVDPKTFNDFALVTGDQAALVRKLHPVRAGAPAPAIIVNAGSNQRADRLAIRKTAVPLTVVGRPAIFPGLSVGSLPLVVVDRTALQGIDVNADRSNQVWSDDAHLVAVRNVIDRAGYNILVEVSPTLLVNTTGLLPLTWIFSYLRALAIMIGLVAIAALVFSLAARTRRRTVSYVLSRRMGLSRIAHLRSLGAELLVVIGFGFVAGAAAGSMAFGVIVHSLDVYPSLPPRAAFAWPGSTWVLVGVAWVVVIAFSSVAVQVLADRANPAQVLRQE